MTDELRIAVLSHIDRHSCGGKYGVRVPDNWIEDANASIIDGQSFVNDKGRWLTEEGRRILRSCSIANKEPSGLPGMSS